LYVFLITLVGGSISVTLLLLLRRGSLKPAEVDRLSGGREMVAPRLKQLCANGFLKPVGGGYELTRRGRALAAAFRSLRRFFHRRTFPTIGTP
jgi:predicted transcriptional regulator